MIARYCVWSAQIRRRSETTRLTVDDSANVHDTVGVLSLPEVGTRQVGEEQIVVKTALWWPSAANSKSEFAMVPEGLSKLTNDCLISSSHSNCQMKFELSQLGSVHTPPTPRYDTSV